MLVKFNPFGSLVERDRFFDDCFTGNLSPAHNTFVPKIDVEENEKEFVIHAELPGLDKKDFSLKIEDNVLTLAGEKKSERKQEEDSSYQIGRSYGSFSRSFRLTDSVDAKKISADYDKGVLVITIPKAEKAKPKEIAISVK